MKPNKGDIYFVPSIYDKDEYYKQKWEDALIDNLWHDSGQVFKTKEEAIYIAKEFKKILKKDN